MGRAQGGGGSVLSAMRTRGGLAPIAAMGRVASSGAAAGRGEVLFEGCAAAGRSGAGGGGS